MSTYYFIYLWCRKFVGKNICTFHFCSLMSLQHFAYSLYFRGVSYSLCGSLSLKINGKYKNLNKQDDGSCKRSVEVQYSESSTFSTVHEKFLKSGKNACSGSWFVIMLHHAWQAFIAYLFPKSGVSFFLSFFSVFEIHLFQKLEVAGSPA